MCVHELKSKVVLLNQVKILEHKIQKFLSSGFFLNRSNKTNSRKMLD